MIERDRPVEKQLINLCPNSVSALTMELVNVEHKGKEPTNLRDPLAP